MSPKDFGSLLKFANKVHALGTKLKFSDSDILKRIKAQILTSVMLMTDPLMTYSNIRQKLMQVQNVFGSNLAGTPAVDPCFMQVADESRNMWPVMPVDPQRPIPLTCYVPGTFPADWLQEIHEVILNYIRSQNYNGTGAKDTATTIQPKHTQSYMGRVAREVGGLKWEANRVLALSQCLPLGLGLSKESQPV